MPFTQYLSRLPLSYAYRKCGACQPNSLESCRVLVRKSNELLIVAWPRNVLKASKISTILTLKVRRRKFECLNLYVPDKLIAIMLKASEKGLHQFRKIVEGGLYFGVFAVEIPMWELNLASSSSQEL